MLESELLNDSQLSLTQYLAEKNNEKVVAKVLWQGFVKRQMPGDAYPQRYWLRQVCLLTTGVPRVLAHVLVPSRTLRRMPWVTHLGPKPLGQVLFRYFSPERSPLSSIQAPLSYFEQGLSPMAKYRFQQLELESTADSLTYVLSGMSLGLDASQKSFDLFLEEVCLDTGL